MNLNCWVKEQERKDALRKVLTVSLLRFLRGDRGAALGALCLILLAYFLRGQSTVSADRLVLRILLHESPVVLVKKDAFETFISRCRIGLSSLRANRVRGLVIRFLDHAAAWIRWPEGRRLLLQIGVTQLFLDVVRSQASPILRLQIWLFLGCRRLIFSQ